ncbi:hypothetical protein [Shewanella sp. NIFS-20-20]|uniref:hypothetical protein n=1 Tax=Shewanella sp. NIFS-20-20 TaxID=2853806 RepID=UPI001C46F8ED|nr:hypothetical protein [Shewanella sp. NIFS-20-20]MBV7316909.1 hypothetical protein [Shewanella sp. NIFS-20-20]
MATLIKLCSMRLLLLLWLMMAMTACVNPNRQLECTRLANTPVQPGEGHYPVVVTHINGDAVVSAPIIYLVPGAYQLTLMMPQSSLAEGYLTMPSSQELTVTLMANYRYQLGGTMASNGQWRADIWQSFAQPCSMTSASN